MAIEEYQIKESSDNNQVKEVYNAFLLGYILFLVNDQEGNHLITTALNDLAISFWVPTKNASIQQNDMSSISGSSSSSTTSSNKSSSSTEQPPSASVTTTSSTSSSNSRASLFRAAKAPPAIVDKTPDTPRTTKRGRKPATPARDDANVVDVETTTKEILQAFEKSPLRKKKRNYKKKTTAKQNVVVNLITEKEEVKKSEPASSTRSRGRPRNSDVSNEFYPLYDDTTSYDPQPLSVPQLSREELLVFEERLKVLEAMNKEEAELKRRATLQQSESLLTQQRGNQQQLVYDFVY